jgi:hypothetical protein
MSAIISASAAGNFESAKSTPSIAVGRKQTAICLTAWLFKDVFTIKCGVGLLLICV